jgi:hypothetical protein
MTDAPPCLLAVRSVTRAATGLSALATGIVGDDNHDGGYHCGRSGVTANDYSVKESPRDKAGLTNWASAFDEGLWEKRVGGKTHNTYSHGIWLVAQCKANTPDSRDIREIIYSPDGKTVKRWDRLGKRSTGDGSHREHTHRSYFRDAVKAGRDLAAIDRRYFTEIGLLEDDDMDQTERLHYATDVADRTVGQAISDLALLRGALIAKPGAKFNDKAVIPEGSVLDLITKAATRPPVALTDDDRADIAGRVLAGLPANFAAQVADELAARLAS